GGLVDEARRFAGQVIRFSVEDSEAAPNHGAVVELVSQADSRREVVQILLAAAVVAVPGAFERLVARIARLHIELGDEAADAEPANRHAVGEVGGLKQL